MQRHFPIRGCKGSLTLHRQLSEPSHSVDYGIQRQRVQILHKHLHQGDVVFLACLSTRDRWDRLFER